MSSPNINATLNFFNFIFAMNPYECYMKHFNHAASVRFTECIDELDFC